MGSPTERRTILFWNTHRGWTEAFAAGRHRYLNPVAEQPSSADGSHDGSPSGVEEIGAAHLRDEDVDLVVLQNPDELELTARWLAVGRASMFPPSTWSTTPQPFAANSLHTHWGDATTYRSCTRPISTG